MDGTTFKIERREFLKLLAGATSGMMLSGYAFNKLTPVGQAYTDWPERIERWVPSVCLQCSGGCGLMARVVDGNVVKLEGNPLHPVNRGRLCPLGHAGLQLVYNPDRIKTPMKRVGGKGSTQWVSIGWDEAINLLAERLGELRERGQPHSLIVLDGRPTGLMGALWERFCQAYGTPNHLPTDEPDGMRIAHRFMQGLDQLFGYDLENANYILSFGCQLLDGWRSPVQLARTYGYLRQERPGPRAKLIQIERRLSPTAARSDEWIPIRPGTEGALALGIAYVLIREELYDRRFIEQYTFGFDDWTDARGQHHKGFRRLVLERYRPENVSAITGVPVDTLIRIAKQFATTRPAVAIGGAEATLHSNGAFNALAIHALNALVGNLDLPGGVLIGEEIPFKRWPPINSDAVAREGRRRPRLDRAEGDAPWLDTLPLEALGERILNGTPYEVQAVFLYASNPVFSTPTSARFAEALERVPLVVSFASFMDESTAYADLILPDHTYLEKWQDGPAPPLSGVPTLGVAQPVIEPLYETRHTGDVILALARRMGETLAAAFPWTDFKEVLMFSVRGCYEARYGRVFSESFEGAFIRQLQERGWWIPQFSSFEAFWEELVKRGGWSGLFHEYGKWGHIFRTPSKRFEFYSQRLKAELEARAERRGQPLDALLEELNITARGDEVFLPHYEPARFAGDESQYPFHLNPFHVLVLNSGSGANLPWMQEIVGLHVHVKWDSWLEIHPETARKLGIADGDWVWVESPYGKVRIRAKLYPGSMPEVVNIPLGLGHTASGRWASGRGVNPYALIGPAADRLGGLPARYATRVKISKA